MNNGAAYDDDNCETATIGHGLILMGGFSVIFPSHVGLAISIWKSGVK